MERMNRPDDICECGHSHYVGKITKPLDSCTHCECEKYNPSPQTSIEASMAERIRPSEGKHDVPRALGVDATDTNTPHGGGNGGDSGRASPDTGTSPTLDFKARIKELKKEDLVLDNDRLNGMKEALEAVEKKIDKKINSPKAVRSGIRDTEMDIAFWNGYKTGLMGLNEEITAWKEKLK